MIERKTLVLLYVYGVLADLTAGGFLRGGKLEITPKGIALFDQMKAEGFQASPEEVMWTLSLAELDCPEKTRKDVAALIELYQNNQLPESGREE